MKGPSIYYIHREEGGAVDLGDFVCGCVWLGRELKQNKYLIMAFTSPICKPVLAHFIL